MILQWDFISFPDNQDCLDTIQSRPTGILAMLDDECRLGARGNDRNWADRLYAHFIPNKNQMESDNTRFSATPIEKSKAIFTVRHFAGPVKYTATTGFLEKNKDEIPVTAHNLFDSAESWLIKEIYTIQKMDTEQMSASANSGKPSKTNTVGQQFKEQLIQLMTKIESTQPHYIRCLKPNDAAKPNMLTRRRLTEQLRYGGVLEAVRVARMGFPVRLDHVHFFQHYRMLLPTISDDKLSWNLEGRDPQALCVKLVATLLTEGKKNADAGIMSPSEDGISRSERIRRMLLQPIPMVFPKTDVQLGCSKVFMRKPAHDALEAHRVFHQTAAATILQAWIRGLQKRVRHLIFTDAIQTVQRFYRGCKGRDKWWRLREAVAGDLLTKNFRMLIVLRRFYRAKDGTVLFQSLYRGYATRRELAAIKVQCQYRMRKQHYSFKRTKSATISLQCRQRRGMAKKVLRGFKGEQKDIGKLKANNEKLKLEMASLKAMLAAEANSTATKAASENQLRVKEAEIAKLERRISELEAELEKEKERVKKIEKKLENEKTRSSKREDEISALRQQNQNLKNVPPPPQSQSTPMRSQSSPMRSPSRKQIITGPTEVEKVYVERDVDPQELDEQKALVARLEEQLDRERGSRRTADGEVIRLRAKINGVKLNADEVVALIPNGDDVSVALTELDAEPTIQRKETNDTDDSEAYR